MIKFHRPLIVLSFSLAAFSAALSSSCAPAAEQAQIEPSESASTPLSESASQTALQSAAQNARKDVSAPSFAQAGGNAERPEITPAAARAGTGHFPVRRCINMGNALEAENEGEWGYTIRARDFTTIARAGFDTVRIPVRWDLKTEPSPPYTVDPALMRRVIQVVRQAQDAGLGVIVDVHHFRNLMANARGPEAEKFLAIWTQISLAFAGAPNTVYFELLNEPTDASMADLNRLYARALKIIRQHNPTRAVIMGGNRWNGLDSLGQVQFPRDPYLVATYHDYSLHDFTHQGASWEDNPPPMGRRWGSRADKADLRDIIETASAFKRRSGLPVFVGEFGVIDEVPNRERAQWMKERRLAMEAAGISWCAWDFAGAFKTYEVDKERWIHVAKDALVGR
jgi:endoglucanase